MKTTCYLPQLVKTLVIAGFSFFSVQSFAQTNTIPTSGNVGIGTTNPTERLTVNGSARIDSTLTVRDSMIVDRGAHIKSDLQVDGSITLEGNLTLNLLRDSTLVDDEVILIDSTGNLKIEFESCPQNKMGSGNSGMEEHQGAYSEIRSQKPEEEPVSKEKQARLYPNPSNDGTFVLQVGEENIISGLRIFTTFGTLINDVRENQTALYRSNEPLPTGTYIIQVLIGNQLEIHKLVVL